MHMPHMVEYSLRAKMIDQRMPEYSTHGPPTSSDSPIGMSKGRRESSASSAVMMMQNGRANSVMKPGMNVTYGASSNSQKSAVAGRRSSLVSSLIASAIDCRVP